jgi:hypothetical protein
MYICEYIVIKKEVAKGIHTVCYSFKTKIVLKDQCLFLTLGMLEKSLIDVDKKERKIKQKTLIAQIVLPITILAILLSMLSLATGDYFCNCYCPTSSNYVGYGT